MKLRRTITHGGSNMDYQHLTTFERGRIEALHKSGYTAREISLQINRHHSTIARELLRNNDTDYCKLSCVSICGDITQDKGISIQSSECNLILNIRALAAPEFLKQTASDVF